MKSERAIWVFILLFILSGTLVCLFFPREAEKNKSAQIRIGAGDDISGLLMEETASHLQDDYRVTGDTQSTSFQDCCSNSAQWAMNAKEINVGFYCSHIARYTVKRNKDVFIYGPLVMNAEVICYKKEWQDVSKAGVTQGREQLKGRTQKTYPQIKEFEEITQKGILYTLEDNQIDAAILDITKAARLSGYEFKPISDTDYISYVLVVDKAFAKTEAFGDFLRSYNRAVDRLSNLDYLKEKLEAQEDNSLPLQVKFLSLDINEE